MNPFEQALSQLARAQKIQPIADQMLARLMMPEREIAVTIPVRMDNGDERIFEGYRVEHSSARGPYKGGIRFHPQTDINEVRALALWMSLKCAVAGIRMGGGKGGVTVNPKELSKGELERLSRGWTRAMLPILGPDKDVPAPDVNTTPEIIGWMADEYANLTGDTSGATFTGKPLFLGGSEGRVEATALGGFYVFDALKDFLGVKRGASVAIQGMGNVGGNAAMIFAREGYKVIAMSDSKGGILNEDGLDPEAVETYKKEKGTLAGFPDAEEITNTELLELECDLLIPAALENQITAENVDIIRATAILELANGPTAPEADDVLFARGVPVVPDILANAGGVIVSTFEWEQNLSGEHWSEEEVFIKLKAILEREAKEIKDLSQELSTDLRRAAFVLALSRLEEAMRGDIV